MKEGEKMAKNYKATKEFKEIRESLIEQLTAHGNDTKFFLDLAQDYMSLWVIKNKLIDDINERGVVCEYQNGKDQWGHKKNDSVSELNKVSQQMLKILTQLKIEAKTIDSLEDDDDEL